MYDPTFDSNLTSCVSDVNAAFFVAGSKRNVITLESLSFHPNIQALGCNCHALATVVCVLPVLSSLTMHVHKLATGTILHMWSLGMTRKIGCCGI